jgi:hypothetical protein
MRPGRRANESYVAVKYGKLTRKATEKEQGEKKEELVSDLRNLRKHSGWTDRGRGSF